MRSIKRWLHSRRHANLSHLVSRILPTDLVTIIFDYTFRICRLCRMPTPCHGSAMNCQKEFFPLDQVCHFTPTFSPDIGALVVITHSTSFLFNKQGRIVDKEWIAEVQFPHRLMRLRQESLILMDESSGQIGTGLISHLL